MKASAYPAVCALLALLSMESHGQSFTFVPEDTILAAPLGTEMVFNVTITNTSAQMLTLVLVRTLNDLPQGWESSMCFSACYLPTTDSIMTTPEYGSSPLNPNESRPFSLHVYTTLNNGAAAVRIDVRNTRDNLDLRTLTFHATSIPVGVKETPETPLVFALEQNFPNPFNPTTVIRYTIPEGMHERILLRVYDLLGCEVATLVNGEMTSGSHEMVFDASMLSSGIYFYRMSAGSFSQSRTLCIVR